MNLTNYQKESLLIFAALLLMVLSSCNQKGDSIPFPQEKSEFLPPSSEPLRFSEPKKINWLVNDSITFKKPVPIKVDLAAVPSKPFYPDGFVPIDYPIDEVSLTMKQDTIINFQDLPSKPINFKTSILEPPVRVKARLPKLNMEASLGIFDFGEDQGLPGYLITALMEDSHGMIWIATDKGICRFDGEYIDRYDIIDEIFNGAQATVTNIIEDESGRIWLYTGELGCYVIDLKAGLVSYSAILNQGFSFSIWCDMILDRRGRIWLGTRNKGVFIIDPIDFSFRHLVNVRPDDNGNARLVVEDGFGNIWIGSNTGLSKIDMKSGIVTSLESTKISSFVNLRGLFCDSENNIWTGSSEDGIVKILPEKGTVQLLDVAQGIQSPIQQFTEGTDGKIWMSSNGGGVYILDPNQQSLKHLNEENVLNSDFVKSTLLDSQGQFWIATAKGINLLNTKGLLPNFLSIKDGLSWQNVWSFMEDMNKNLWLGAWETIDIYDAEKNTIKRVDDALQLRKRANIGYEIIQMPAGDYLIKVPGSGLAIFNPELETISKITREHGLSITWHASVLADRSGKIWSGAFGNAGLEVYDPNNHTFKRITSEEGLLGSILWGLHEDPNGQIWIGTDLGINIINIEDNTISYLMEGESTSDRNTGSFLTDKENRLWIGTRSGILVADQKNELLTSISSENGLISEAVYTLYEEKGVMYVGTENGMSTFIPPANFNTNKTALDIKSYGKEQGLIFNDFNANAAISYNDKLWLGIETEVLTVTEIPKKDTVAGVVYISGITISDKTCSFYDTDAILEKYPNLDTLYTAQNDTLYLSEKLPKEVGWLKETGITWDGIDGYFNLPRNLTIPFEQNYVSFQFTGTQLTNRDKTRYSYILEGFDSQWSDISNEAYSKNYRSLPAGNYTFKVRSRTFDGIWSQPAEFSFTILPHWTNTWWARILYIITFIIVVRSIVQYRSRTLQRENVILDEKVKIRTQELEAAKVEVETTLENLKSTQSQLIQAEKMASLGELTAGIAHEIQNPLNFVNNFSEINKELIEDAEEELAKGDLDEVRSIFHDLKSNEEKISQHGRRADSIVKGMLMHSRSNKGEKIPTDINALCDEFLRLSYHGLRAKDRNFNADFETHFDATIPKINIIPQDMGRVMLNLINNAFQATKEMTSLEAMSSRKGQKPLTGLEVEAGGLESLSTLEENKIRRTALSGVVKVQTKNLGDKIQITVSDNGPGIPDEIKDKIFQPFFTTRPTGQGTGLGLSLSYDIVKAHGGEINVISKEGEGTKFIINLPY